MAEGTTTKGLDGNATGDDLRRVDEHAETPAALLDRAAKGTIEQDDSEAIRDASEWLLQSAAHNEDITHLLELNVGSHTKPELIRWRIRAVDGPVIRKIREEAAGNREQRRAGVSLLNDANRVFAANVKIVVEGTVEPDLKALAAREGHPAAGLMLEDAFRKKQGLIDQIAGEVMAISGYDDEDVRDAREQGAASSSRG